jgi:CRISPR-associated protein Cas2
MEVLVSYDVATDTTAGRRRLRKVAQICLGYGQRVQKSVFECSINEMLYEQLRERLLKCIDTEEDMMWLYSSGHTETRATVTLERCVR